MQSLLLEYYNASRLTSNQDYGVKANLKSEALIDLLMDTQ